MNAYIYYFWTENELFSSKENIISFAIHSFFRNFGFAELTGHSEMKRKATFLLQFIRFFVTLPAKR